jgi:hypothetical protein
MKFFLYLLVSTVLILGVWGSLAYLLTNSRIAKYF